MKQRQMQEAPERGEVRKAGRDRDVARQRLEGHGRGRSAKRVGVGRGLPPSPAQALLSDLGHHAQEDSGRWHSGNSGARGGGARRKGRRGALLSGTLIFLGDAQKVREKVGTDCGTGRRHCG